MTRLADTTVQYICNDSLYADTVTFLARSLLGNGAKKDVVITVVNRPPLCDSMSVAGHA